MRFAPSFLELNRLLTCYDRMRGYLYFNVGLLKVVFAVYVFLIRFVRATQAGLNKNPNWWAQWESNASDTQP